jgi:hypothetical protein
LANLNWVAAVLSPLAVILMEVFWVYPWLTWAKEWPVLNWQRLPLSLASLILLIGISFSVTKFFLSRRQTLRWIQLGILLLTIFMVVRIEYSAGFKLLSGQWFVYTAQIFLDTFSHPHPIILAVITSVYLCWRGIRLGHSALYFNDIYPSFLVGLIALVVLIIVWTASLGVGSLESLASTVGLYVVGFFFFGLAAMALGNLLTVRRKLLREETAPLSNRRWLAILFGVVGGIVLLGIGIASAFSPGFVALLTRLLSLTIDLLREAIRYLLIPLTYLAEGLVYIVGFIINLIRGGRPLKPFETPELFKPLELPERAAGQAATVDVVLILKWVFFALIVIAVVFFLARAIFRLRSLRAEAEVEEISESLWSWQGFKKDLRLFFSGIWRRRRKRTKPAPVSPVPSWYLGDIPGMLDIRQIFRHLLWESSTFGITRRRHETPHEFTRRLGQAVPDSSEKLGELTNLYVEVRYGDLEVKDEKVEHANNLWRVLRRLLRAPKLQNN